MKNKIIKKVFSHLKEDKKEFLKQIKDDKKLKKELSRISPSKKKKR